MIFIFDTSTCSDILREHPNTLARMNRVSEVNELVTSSIVVGEVMYGLHRMPTGRRRTLLWSRAEDCFNSLRCIPVSEAIAHIYAELKHLLEAKGRSMSENDLWIASTALELSATLMSRDSDFANVDGLRLEDWTCG